MGGASLDFYPYYVIEYKLEISKNDPSGKKHNIQNQEIVIVDAFNGELLSLSDKKRTKVVNKLNPFLSQRNADLASSDIAERNQITNDLKNIESIVNLKLHPAGDYAINLIDNKVSPDLGKLVLPPCDGRFQDCITRNGHFCNAGDTTESTCDVETIRVIS